MCFLKILTIAYNNEIKCVEKQEQQACRTSINIFAFASRGSISMIGSMLVLALPITFMAKRYRQNCQNVSLFLNVLWTAFVYIKAKNQAGCCRPEHVTTEMLFQSV